jgi:hypothetical protein
MTRHDQFHLRQGLLGDRTPVFVTLQFVLILLLQFFKSLLYVFFSLPLLHVTWGFQDRSCLMLVFFPLISSSILTSPVLCHEHSFVTFSYHLYKQTFIDELLKLLCVSTYCLPCFRPISSTDFKLEFKIIIFVCNLSFPARQMFLLNALTFL